MTSFDDYISYVNQSLMSFQFIEELIRMYLERCYWIIRKKVGEDLAITLSRNDIEKLSLGGLLKEFKKFNANADLINGMHKLIPWRNRVAHQALLFTFVDFDGEREEWKMRIDHMRKVSLATKGCIDHLGQEVAKLETVMKRLGWEEGQSITND